MRREVESWPEGLGKGDGGTGNDLRQGGAEAAGLSWCQGRVRGPGRKACAEIPTT